MKTIASIETFDVADGDKIISVVITDEAGTPFARVFCVNGETAMLLCLILNNGVDCIVNITSKESL